MNSEEFLQGLKNALAGEIPSAAAQENLKYYKDYIQTEIGRGRTEQQVMEELGDPRLIARTIIDTTPEGGQNIFEEYRSDDAYTGSSRRADGEYGSPRWDREDRGQTRIRYYDLGKWYWKLLGIFLLMVVVSVVLLVVSGFLSLVLPMLPVLGLVAVIMWFIRGSRR